MTSRAFRHLTDESLLLEDHIERLADRLLAIVREVYYEIGGGLPEAVYQEALEIAFEEAGLRFQAQPHVQVRFRDRTLKRHATPDFLIEETIVLELKSVEGWSPAHDIQLLTYLRLTQRPLGFLVNFRAPSLSAGLRRKVLHPSS